MKAIAMIKPGDETISLIEAEDKPSLKTLQGYVEGYIEMVPRTLFPADYVMLVNEEGRFSNSKFNRLASGLVGTQIFGNAIILRVVRGDFRAIDFQKARKDLKVR